jgi:hypothetical protein
VDVGLFGGFMWMCSAFSRMVGCRVMGIGLIMNRQYFKDSDRGKKRTCLRSIWKQVKRVLISCGIHSNVFMPFMLYPKKSYAMPMRTSQTPQNATLTLEARLKLQRLRLATTAPPAPSQPTPSHYPNCLAYLMQPDTKAHSLV